jgi:hypothetical protein
MGTYGSILKVGNTIRFPATYGYKKGFNMNLWIIPQYKKNSLLTALRYSVRALGKVQQEKLEAVLADYSEGVIRQIQTDNFPDNRV